jgi:hypothetical protein
VTGFLSCTAHFLISIPKALLWQNTRRRENSRIRKVKMSNDPSRVSLGSNAATVEAGMILCGFNKKPMAALSRPRI